MCVAAVACTLTSPAVAIAVQIRVPLVDVQVDAAIDARPDAASAETATPAPAPEPEPAVSPGAAVVAVPAPPPPSSPDPTDDAPTAMLDDGAAPAAGAIGSDAFDPVQGGPDRDQTETRLPSPTGVPDGTSLRERAAPRPSVDSFVDMRRVKPAEGAAAARTQRPIAAKRAATSSDAAAVPDRDGPSTTSVQPRDTSTRRTSEPARAPIAGGSSVSPPAGIVPDLDAPAARITMRIVDDFEHPWWSFHDVLRIERPG